MRNTAFALVAALSLSACASTQTVLSEEPNEVFFTDSSPNEVAFCLANKNNTPAMDRDDGSKVVLVKNAYGGVSLAFTIWPDGEGSRVEYRRAFGTIGASWKQCVGA
ncbi:hypothetical protein [Erythrobacter sp. HI0074]|uniref:hypothetical protein n=3 Tax=unclassified Erythrobacter TaxID=2633097 RepID=UPI0009EEC465|nr:hypothetical protein [Erythrobacter sp. HI0074]